MGLKAYRSENQKNYDLVHPRTSERGGVLTIIQASGIDYADYSIDPSGKTVLGIKANDHEWIELWRQEDPTKIRRVTELDGIVWAIVEGEVITDWVHPDYAASIKAGDVAYAGPSGTLVNTDDYAGGKVGIFLSRVGSSHYGLNRHDSYTVLLGGGGLTYTWMDPDTHIVTTVNAEKIFVPVGGWVKLRVNPEY